MIVLAVNANSNAAPPPASVCPPIGRSGWIKSQHDLTTGDPQQAQPTPRWPVVPPSQQFEWGLYLSPVPLSAGPGRRATDRQRAPNVRFACAPGACCHPRRRGERAPLITNNNNPSSRWQLPGECRLRGRLVGEPQRHDPAGMYVALLVCRRTPRRAPSQCAALGRALTRRWAQSSATRTSSPLFFSIYLRLLANCIFAAPRRWRCLPFLLLFSCCHCFLLTLIRVRCMTLTSIG